MNGLEAIELMKQGKMVEDHTGIIYRIENNVVQYKTHYSAWTDDATFSFVAVYEEYVKPKPLVGWERVNKTQTHYYINGFDVVGVIEANDAVDKIAYERANYFSTEEKAEEINFKQTLFRKLQRLSDENGGNGINWNNNKQCKWMIRFDHGTRKLYVVLNTDIQDLGPVYFTSKEIAERAIELFHNELIKYFMGE